MYKNKYLKYKNKYIELKNIMTGGNVNKLILNDNTTDSEFTNFKANLSNKII